MFFLLGLARDLRGIAFAFNTKTSYMMLFDWIYPAYTPVLQRAIEIWYQDPQVTTPVLKLFAGECKLIKLWEYWLFKFPREGYKIRFIFGQKVNFLNQKPYASF